MRLGAKLRRVTAHEYVGPCPKCGGRDRFAINTSRGLFNCRGCEVGGDQIELARHILGVGFREAAEFVDDERVKEGEARDRARSGSTSRPTPPPAPQSRQVDEIGEDDNRPDEKRIADAVALFRESISLKGTPAETYAASRRLVTDDIAGRVLRWNPRIGALVALFRNVVTGDPQAVSRTFLDAEARKIERKFLGPVGGAAIMLDPFDSIAQGLHVGEGIETCQSARQLGLRPTWALGSAGAIATFPILSGVECLTLLAENDSASAKAVETCGTRWFNAGRIVLINKPIGGKDLNDALRRVA